MDAAGAPGSAGRPQVFGLDPVIFLMTLAFALALAIIIFCLGRFLLGMPLWRAAAIGAGLGLTQAVGSLVYIWRRFKHHGQPPRDGGMPG